MIVVPGPASRSLGSKIATLLGTRRIACDSKTFPDGEVYIRLDDDMQGEEVVIVQTLGSPQNDHLVQLFLMADTARDHGAKEVTAVVPYFAYTRQDKRFSAGEAFSLKTMMTLLEAVGVTRVMTVNSHNPPVLKGFDLPVQELSAIGLLAEHLQKRGFRGAVSLSLGKKGMDIAQQASGILEGEYDWITTTRDRSTGTVEVDRKPLSVKNQDVVIFDDIISSGGTMAKAVKAVCDQGAERVYAACVHPLLIGKAVDRIMQSGATGIIGTDTVPSSVSVVSVDRLISDALRGSEDTPK